MFSSSPIRSVDGEGYLASMPNQGNNHTYEKKDSSLSTVQHMVNFIALQTAEEWSEECAVKLFETISSSKSDVVKCVNLILKFVDSSVEEGQELSGKNFETISEQQLPPSYCLECLAKQPSKMLEKLSYLLQVTICFSKKHDNMMNKEQISQCEYRYDTIKETLEAVDTIMFYGMSRLSDLKAKNSRRNVPFWETKLPETISNIDKNTSKKIVVNEDDSRNTTFEAGLLASLKSMENDIDSGKFETAITELKSLPGKNSINAKGVSEEMPLAFWNLGMAFGRCAVRFQTEVNTVRNRLTKAHSKILEQAVKALEYSGECIMVAKEFYADEGDKITCDQELLAVFEQHKYLSELLGTIKGKSEHRFLFAEQKVFVNRSFQLLGNGGREIESSVEIRGRITTERQARRTSADVDETYNPNPKK